MDFMPESTAVTTFDRAQHIITRKRTDHRSMVESSSSSYYSGGDGGCMISYHQSPAMSSEEEEEEDMANCLIMLAQNVSHAKIDKPDSDIFCQKTKKLKVRSVTEMAAVTGGENSGYQSYYECKTCNRTFSSFQALGGHRASHKKPKPTVDDKNSDEDQLQRLVVDEENKTITNKLSSSPVTHDYMQTVYKNSKSTKVHECSICGSEFLSGQALGGHMRRHRTAPALMSPIKAKLSPESKKMNEKSPVLSLDLNLPPPEFVFSASALVDCYY